MKGCSAYELSQAMEQLNALLELLCGAKCMPVDDVQALMNKYPQKDLRDTQGIKLLPFFAYVVVVAPNGYEYYINVTADSAITACAEVLNFARSKF